MTTFLLDQNVNKKTFSDSCNAQGLASTRRFPKHWAAFPGGFKDPELLRAVMSGKEPLLTNDRRIASSHSSAIPNIHPGIIIVGHPPSHATPIRKGELEKIVAKFKNQFPWWHLVSWSNSIVEITPASVEVSHVEFGNLNQDEYIARTEADCAQRVKVLLRSNEQRSFSQLP